MLFGGDQVGFKLAILMSAWLIIGPNSASKHQIARHNVTAAITQVIPEILNFRRGAPGADV